MYSIEQFQRRVGRIVEAKADLSMDDLPDTVCLDDYFYEDMDKEEYLEAAQECAEEILSNAGFVEPVISTENA